MTTLADFITTHQLTMRTIRLLARPDRGATKWDATASHWQCEIRRGFGPRPKLYVNYSMGSAHTPPRLANVLNSLVLNASGVDASFEDWANEYGYSTDSLEGQATYHTCKQQTTQLRALFTSEEYAALLETERL